MSQTTDLIELLKQGWVTPLDALKKIGCLNFGARIINVQKRIAGYPYILQSDWVKVGAKRVKQFRLIERRM